MSSKSNSARWKQRQAKDPYVKRAKREGIASRSYYKLEQLDKRFGLVKAHSSVIDLGAAPGGWSQYVHSLLKTGLLVSVDCLPMKSRSPSHIVLCNDISTTECLASLKTCFTQSKASLILSDAAPNLSGMRDVDMLKSEALLDSVERISGEMLRGGGSMVVKSFDSVESAARLVRLKTHYRTVLAVKPSSSRKESRERYLVCLGKIEKRVK